MATRFWKQIAQVMLDAVDVDLRTFQQELIGQMRRHAYGRHFANWASKNPIPYEILVRSLSSTIKSQNRKLRSRGMVAEALADQLANLPYDFQCAFNAPLSDEQNSDGSVEATIFTRAPSLDELATLIALTEDAREQGEFLGALMREFIRVLEPEKLAQHINRFEENRVMQHPPLGSKSSLSVSEQETFIRKLPAEFFDTDSSNTHSSSGPIDLNSLADDFDQPLPQAIRVIRSKALLNAMRSPAGHSPILPANSSTLHALPVLISATLAFLKEARPKDFSELVESKSNLSKVREIWTNEQRPKQWMQVLSIVDAII
jgi:hypothetical protein